MWKTTALCFGGAVAYGVGAANTAAAITAVAPVAAAAVPYLPVAAIGVAVWRVGVWMAKPADLPEGDDPLLCSACGTHGTSLKKKRLESGAFVIYFSKCGHTVGVAA